MTTPAAAPASLHDRALAWAAADPDAATRAELEALVRDGADAELADRLDAALEFGTAGLRGVVGAGPNRMNRAVVRRTTFAVADVLEARVGDAKTRGVVVGRDGRRMSEELVADVTAVLVARGFRVHLWDTPGPTPLVAFATRALGAAAGVMITASHNPPEYNGYKLYWESGAQIVPPIDEEVAAAILRAPRAVDVPCPTLDAARTTGLVTTLGDAEVARYVDAVLAERLAPAPAGTLRVAYTPLHGVGRDLLLRVLAAAGHRDVHVEPSQAAPDGAFPTVAFPNPEEKGAMDRVFALGREVSAALVVANDPDADRLAVAVPDASAPAGFRQLTGNEVGVLLGHAALAAVPPDDRARSLVIMSIVSSPMLATMARAAGARCEQVLTGFKWIAARAMELEASEGLVFRFGYEEALGYTLGTPVRDKDGVLAALALVDLAATLASRGETLLDALDALYRAHGVFVSSQVSVVRKGLAGAAELKGMMTKLRTSPPATLGGAAVVASRDYASGEAREAGVTRPMAGPRSDVLVFDLAGGGRVIARPSGTEPKMKLYVDVREDVRPGEVVVAARTRALARLAELEADVRRAVGVT